MRRVARTRYALRACHADAMRREPRRAMYAYASYIIFITPPLCRQICDMLLIHARHVTLPLMLRVD